MRSFLLDLAKWAAVSVAILATGMLAMSVCGCSSPAVSEPAYPKYDKWWVRHPVESHVDDFGVVTYTQLL